MTGQSASPNPYVKVFDDVLREAFQPVLEDWLSLVEHYALNWNGTDSPYWYNERATLSSFAAAVWRKGGLALEEYRATKRYGTNDVTGRSDMYFEYPARRPDSQGSKPYYIVEAKQMWPALSTAATLLPRVNTNLKLAKSQATAARRHQGGTGVALVFVCPYYNPYAAGITVGRLIDSFTLELQTIGRGAVAYTFPPSLRTLRSSRKNKAYPGVAIVARRTKETHS